MNNDVQLDMHLNTRQATALMRDVYANNVCDPLRPLLPENDLQAVYAVQQQLGAGQPEFSVLFADMAICDGKNIDTSRILQPKVEAEVAWVLNRVLGCNMPTVAYVIHTTKFLLPTIEIVGSRLRPGLKRYDCRQALNMRDQSRRQQSVRHHGQPKVSS